MINVFFSYSHKDENYREKLESHLSSLTRQGYVSAWHDRKIEPGEDWNKEISENLECADVIMLLVSSDFLSSDYCFGVEVKRALQRHSQKNAIVIPVVLRYCDWRTEQFSKLQALPVNANPICSGYWESEDQAFLNVVEGVKKVINKIRSGRERKKKNIQPKSVSLRLGSVEKIIDRYILDNSTFIGIDFGTSTTVVSLVSLGDDNCSLLIDSIDVGLFSDAEITHGQCLIPSVLYYDQRKDTLLFGMEAKSKKSVPGTYEGVNYWSSFKMGLGKDLGAIYRDSLVNDGDSRIFNPKDATEVFLYKLKTKIDEYINLSRLSKNLKVCVSIPASFEANQRRELLDAVKKSGIEVHENTFIDEPNAAFLSYINQENNEFAQGNYGTQLTLVFDFGAGTCDVSILEFGEKQGGFYSKNVAISRFEKLGGDDIDRRISRVVMFPEFCDEFDLDPDEISEQEYYDWFEPKFKPAAETLKIRMSDKFSKLIKKKKNVPDFAIFREEPIRISYKGNDYVYDAQTLTKSDFERVMSEFILANNEFSKTSVFYIIDSALVKAKVEYEDIDNVLLVGGSCKNPVVVGAIESAFKNASVFVPNNIQVPVSQGSAINAILSIGLNSPPIAPVVSETISIRVADEKYFPIIKQGEGIPHFKEVAGKLVIQKDKQKAIEMPLYVSGSNKMLETIVIYAEGFFNKSDSIKMTAEINSNKVVIIKVYCNGRQLNTKELSPFSNEVLTPYKKAAKETEREINELISKGFTIHDNSLQELVDSLITIHAECNDYKSAMECTIKYFPGRYGDIAYYAHCAGSYAISSKYTHLAYEKDPSALNAYNLSLEYDEKSDEHLKYLKEASDGGYLKAQVDYAEIAQTMNSEQYRKLMLGIFDSLYSKYQNGYRLMHDEELDMLVSAVESLGFFDIKKSVEEKKKAGAVIKKKAANSLFEKNNLLKEISI